MCEENGDLDAHADARLKRQWDDQSPSNGSSSGVCSKKMKLDSASSNINTISASVILLDKATNLQVGRPLTSCASPMLTLYPVSTTHLRLLSGEHKGCSTLKLSNSNIPSQVSEIVPDFDGIRCYLVLLEQVVNWASVVPADSS